MRFTIKTKVDSPKVVVKAGFTRELFLRINPPFPSVKLIQFDGCQTGNKIKLQLNFILFKQDWMSLVTEDIETADSWYFVDEGIQLPFFLKKWRHQHGVVQQAQDQSVLIDDITFSTGTLLTDVLLFPLLYVQFWYRKPIYKRTFINHK